MVVKIQSYKSKISTNHKIVIASDWKERSNLEIASSSRGRGTPRNDTRFNF